MEPREPRPSAAESALRRLEERLDRASEAAERLLGDAAAAASNPPPAGWQIPGSSSEERAGGDFDLLVQVVHALADLIPDELQQRLAGALRELLLALRALIDWYLERGERRRSARAEVQDIPIT